jgi:hypothetical protein
MIYPIEAHETYQKFKNKIDSHVQDIQIKTLEGINNNLVMIISFPYSIHSSQHINLIIAVFSEFYYVQPVVKTETINNRTIIHLFCDSC